MIAPAQPRSSSTWHSDFMALVPAVRRYAQFAFRHLDPAACEEAIAEAIAAALVAYLRLVQRGRRDVVYPAPLARYAVHHVRNGRHVGGHENNGDVLSPSAQQRHGFKVGSLDSGRQSWVDQLVVQNGKATPADIAATRLDFKAWLGTLSPRNGEIARLLAAGESTKETARKFRLSEGRISQLRRELHESWQQFQGEPSST